MRSRLYARCQGLPICHGIPTPIWNRPASSRRRLTDWQETQVLNGRIGDCTPIAGKDRNSDDWYIGIITDEDGWVLDVPLYFLDPDRTYEAESCRDGAKRVGARFPIP